MTVAVQAPARTPIKESSAAKAFVDRFEYVEPTMMTVGAGGSLGRLHSPYSGRESTECAVVLAHQPMLAGTAPPAFQGEIKSFANAYWLITALTEPLATGTIASFELPHRWMSTPSPWRELTNYFIHHPEPSQELRAGALLTTVSPEHLLDSPQLLEERDEQSVGRTRAYRAFVELAGWLRRTQEETAQLLGMGRTTPLAWERDGHEPQPANARRLYQSHALVSTLVRRLGAEEALRWLESGDPAPLSLIAEGDVVGADDRADELIFGTAPSRERLSAWVDDLEDDAASPVARPAQDPPRRVRRRSPRRRTP